MYVGDTLVFVAPLLWLQAPESAFAIASKAHEEHDVAQLPLANGGFLLDVNATFFTRAL